MIYPNAQSMRLGVVMRKAPGVTRWAKWSWKAIAVLPGAAEADWKLLRSDGEAAEYHAATKDLWLYVSDTEAYAHEFGTQSPSVYIVLRPTKGSSDGQLDVVHVTVSPYEAQDYCDSGEEIVEKVAMPPAVYAWVRDFIEAYHVEEPFVKRRRNKQRVDRKDDGIGDRRISQATDVYRAPVSHPREAAE
ncbi:conserved hypothetical protein [Roseobacter denitrificans OCh 114]|uniref:Molybdopterin-guanine dinucleotide biosynthesis protein A n=2 Tax=Roseobacter denitrificans TaxID=2434 RepID=Q165B8_ROSDO|nr:conserved hypothetical protein [Roseobacter denitrificans OCh 114]